MIQDSLGFWIPRRRLRIPGTGFQSLSNKLESGSQSLVRFRIPKPKILDFMKKMFSDSRLNKPKFSRFPSMGEFRAFGKKKITVCVLRST